MKTYRVRLFMEAYFETVEGKQLEAELREQAKRKESFKSYSTFPQVDPGAN